MDMTESRVVKLFQDIGLNFVDVADSADLRVHTFHVLPESKLNTAYLIISCPVSQRKSPGNTEKMRDPGASARFLLRAGAARGARDRKTAAGRPRLAGISRGGGGAETRKKQLRTGRGLCYTELVIGIPKSPEQEVPSQYAIHEGS